MCLYEYSAIVGKSGIVIIAEKGTLQKRGEHHPRGRRGQHHPMTQILSNEAADTLKVSTKTASAPTQPHSASTLGPTCPPNDFPPDTSCAQAHTHAPTSQPATVAKAPPVTQPTSNKATYSLKVSNQTPPTPSDNLHTNMSTPTPRAHDLALGTPHTPQRASGQTPRQQPRVHQCTRGIRGRSAVVPTFSSYMGQTALGRLRKRIMNRKAQEDVTRICSRRADESDQSVESHRRVHEMAPSNDTSPSAIYLLTNIFAVRNPNADV